MPTLSGSEIRGGGIGALLAAACLAATYLLAACLKPDTAALNSVSAAPRSSPDCAACHAYPLHDVNHAYHLRAFNTRESMQAKFEYERSNGILVCMDCHFGSVAHRAYNWYDTLWGTEGDVRAKADKKADDPIYRIDSIPGFLPLPADMKDGEANSDTVNARMQNAARIGDMVEWLTSKKHLNGVVDVEFSPNIVLDTAFSKSAFRVRDLSCSAIECHNAPRKTYRWASQDLRLPGCPTVEHLPDVDTSCGYSPKQEPK